MNVKFLLLVLSLTFIFPANAHAYIDPGVGSMLLQGLAAAALTAGVFWRRILNFFKEKFGKKNDDL